MADLFAISTSALQAFQTAIAVTSNNIANANTPGYSQESANLTAAPPQSNGTIPIGAGVLISGITRAFSQLATNQLNNSQAGLGQLNSLQTYTNQLDNIVGTTAGGLTTALQSYYNAWSTLANNPTSTAARQALLSAAQTVASSFQNTTTQLQNLDASVNTGVTSDVQQINSIANSIKTLNTQIVAATAQGGGQAPNTLLDQRGALLTNLANLTGFTTTNNTDGSINVFVGNGTPLVLDQNTTTLTTVGNPFNAAQLEVATTTNPKVVISGQFTSGDLGGLLSARSQVIDPAINQLGQIATALAHSANAQQNAGLDLTGKFGATLFSVAAPQAIASSNNTDATTASVSVNNVGALTTDSYLLTYAGGAYTLTNATTGSAVALTSIGTAANPSFTADGLTISLSGTPAANDQFLIQPTANASGSFSVALTGTSQLAASGALESIASNANTGTGAIGTPTVVNAANLGVLTPATITFTSPTAYSINGVAQGTAYSPGTPITFNGWQVSISGAPATGDSFTVQPAPSGNNANALANAAQQSQGVLSNGSVSINGAVDALVTGIGSQAQQVNTAQTAQAAINTQAQQSVQSVSGVNLDTEAANLLKWQQAYQASAQALVIGNQMFTTLIDSVNGTYS
ncbi:MAG: flagellar hook-associated protein FlgK [Steroidobacterales bacterium]